MLLELIGYYNLNYVAADKQEQHRTNLSLEEKRLWDRRTPRLAIQKYGCSLFLYLFKSGNN